MALLPTTNIRESATAPIKNIENQSPGVILIMKLPEDASLRRARQRCFGAVHAHHPDI